MTPLNFDFPTFPSIVVVVGPFRLLHPIHITIHFYFLTFNRQFPLLSLTQLGFEKFHPSYSVVLFSFHPSYRTLSLNQLDPFNLRYPSFHHPRRHCTLAVYACHRRDHFVDCAT